MSIVFTCKGCQSKLKAPDAAAGRSLSCPKCSAVNDVPAQLSATQPFSPNATVPEQRLPAPPATNVVCPHCRGTVVVQPGQLGKVVACPFCNQSIMLGNQPTVVLPSPSAPDPTYSIEPPLLPSSPKTSLERDPPPFDRYDDEDDDFERRPARRRSKTTANSGSGTTALVLGLLAILMMPILGPVAIIVGNQALRENPDDGNATAGVVMGWIATVLLLLAVGFICLICGIGGLAGAANQRRF